MLGGLVKAFERVIKLDGTSPQDENCKLQKYSSSYAYLLCIMVGQFYLYKRFDVSHTPQNVYRLESVKYSYNNVNLYWNEHTKEVYLQV